MPIKLIAFDLDGTLVANLSTISDRVHRAIQTAIEQGLYVTLATGREFDSAAEFARRLNINAPLICYQGGLVKDHRGGETLLARAIPAGLSRRVIKFARANKMPMLLYTPLAPFAELPTPLMRDIFNRAGSPFQLVNNLLAVLDDNNLPLKFLFNQPEADSDAVLQALRREFGDALTLSQSLETMVEATLPGVSKGEALRHLAEHLRVPLAQTLAVGDQDNDVSMIEAAGLGIAMGNASAKAKAAAQVIAPSLADDGAAWALETYALDGRNG